MIRAPLRIAATVIGSGGCEISQTARGNTVAPTIDPAEMWRVQATITRKTIAVANRGMGARHRYAPVKLATALPPFPPRKSGKAWPAITATAAADIHNGLDPVSRPASQTAR